jgi:cytidyltransferase-like protein
MWVKNNHGGSPTKNKDKKYAIFVGRYQPYHYGHIELIKQKLNDGVPCLIMVRDIEPDEKNPFTTDQTVNMIEKYHKSKGDDVKVMVIPDIESINYGRGVGYEINEYKPPKDSGAMFISATKIRESIKNGNDDWKTMVDLSLHKDIIDYLTDKK